MSYPHQSLPEQRPSGHPFQVFQDDQHPTHPSSTFISSAGYLPSEQMRTKENTETPLPWNLASISTLQTHSQPDQQTAFDDFSVFSDEPAEPQLLRTADPFSGPAESHQSQYQPLQSKLATFDNFLSASVPLVQQQMVNHADHAPETTTPPPQTHFENVDRNNTEDEVEGEEIFSVEEIRLKKHLQRMKEKEEALQRAAEAKLEEENRQIAEERMMVDTPAVPQQTEPNLRATTAGTDDDFDFTHANTIFGVFGSIYGAGEETPQPTRSTMTVTLPAILGVDETDNAGHDERADGWAADEDNQPLSDDVGRDTLTTAMLFGGEFGRLSHPRKRSRQTLRDSESPRHSGFGELDDDALCRSTKRMKLELTSPLRDPSKYSMNTLLMNDIIQPQSSFHTPPRQSRRSSFHNSTQTPPRGHSPPALSGVTSPFTFKARDEPLRRSDSSERSQKLVEREIVGERKSVNQEDILEGVSKDRQKREDLKDKTRKGMIEERCEPEHDKITTLQLFADLDDIGENSFLDREDTVIGGGTPGPSNRTNQFTPNRRWNDETAARLERTSEPRMDKENASWTDNGRSDAALPSTLNFLLDTHPTNLTSLDPFGYRPTISHLHQSPPSPHTSPPSHSFDTTIRNTVHTKAAINDVMLMFTNSRPAPVLSPAKRTPFQVRPNKVTFSATTPSTAGFLGAHATPVAPHTSSISTPFACTTPSTQNNSRQPLSVVAQRTTNADILTQSRMGQRNLVTPAKSPYLTAVDPLPNYSSFRQEPTALATPSHSATTQQAPPRMTMFGDIDGAETSWSVFKDI
ncbi:hypothetical protein BLNAU_551 [Blattamonas nauphoetae]|uniref:Uncharacterized protein n=1 Tax=Blattamonas nauphoetae TaxID=2049346 RepID=A0ABQ9YLJ8_9EUKA|nr:hypothetical protein BLNAU_551 [Blattamonas nauphoetae]